MGITIPPRCLATAVLFAAGLFALAGPARSAPPASPVSTVVLATEEWSWEAFTKYWKKQFGKTSGVLGIVLLVGLGAVLLILSKGRGT